MFPSDSGTMCSTDTLAAESCLQKIQRMVPETPNDQRLSAALTNPAEVKAFNAADEPRWTEPLLVTETAVAV